MEEVETETPIHPPSDSKEGSLVRVKQEDGVDPTKMEKCQAPRRESSEHAVGKRWKRGDSDSDSGEELGLAKSSVRKPKSKSSSSLESSHGEYSTMEHTSESMTRQDTTGEGDGMLELDEEDTEMSE